MSRFSFHLQRFLATRLMRVLLTPVGERVPFPRRATRRASGSGARRGAPNGVALFVVLISLALMSAIVTDLGSNEIVRYRQASNDRDAMKAQALADSAVNLSRLLLAMQAAVNPCITQLDAMGIPLPAHTFWQLVPLDSELLKGVTSGELQGAFGLDVEERKTKLAEQQVEKLIDYDADAPGASKEPFTAPEGGFGLFDGTFKVDIQDEEQKAATLAGWRSATPQKCFETAKRLFAVVQPERYDFLFEDRDDQGNRTDRFELVANLYDWIDDNQEGTDGRGDQNSWCRPAGGAEDAVYSSGYKVLPRNAYFDSPAELRMVRGMTDAHMKAFADKISIYGENKVNIRSAPLSTIEVVILSCAQPGDPLVQNPTWMQETLQAWQEWGTLGALGGGGPVTPDGFLAFLDTRGLAVQPECKNQLSTESKTFTVRGMATVGEVTRTITTVMRIVGTTEENYYYSIR